MNYKGRDILQNMIFFFLTCFPTGVPRIRLCANLTEQALRTRLGFPGSELVLSWLTAAIGHMTDVWPSSVNPMDKWKASRPGSPCLPTTKPTDIIWNQSHYSSKFSISLPLNQMSNLYTNIFSKFFTLVIAVTMSCLAKIIAFVLAADFLPCYLLMNYFPLFLSCLHLADPFTILFSKTNLVPTYSFLI